MLLQINISNFALIEALKISFESGFNILAGETGAGKSILIDAINYVLGVKFTKSLIRTGENKTYVEAVFTIENSKTKDWLNKYEIDYEDLVIISREAFQSGKTVAKVNGKTVLLASLKTLSETLIDIHGQHENQSLMTPEMHIMVLDNYGEEALAEVKESYSKYFEELKKINEKIDELQKKTGDKEKVADYLKYQIEEIENAKLKLNEDIELEQQYKIISNSETIKKVMCESYERLYGSGDNISIFDNLGIVIKDLRNIEKHSDKIKKISDSLEDTYYNLEQNVAEIRDMKDSIDYDDKELEYINNRIYLIDSLKKKYGTSIEAINNYKNKISDEYEQLINCSEIIEELFKKREITLQELRTEAEKIHEIRLSISEELEKKVFEELKYIGLEKSTFKINIEFDCNNFSETGADKVQFYISTNPGEPPKPLEKVVSGGELSRIMLAIKTVFVDKDRIPSVIFDEIDTGISGRIAQSVAEKMYEISKMHQVFCVTHLPQIACMSDVHYLVKKEIINDKTFTKVNKLSKAEKEDAIAKMIGGSEVTKLTLEHAKEMINLANQKKIIK